MTIETLSTIYISAIAGFVALSAYLSLLLHANKNKLEAVTAENEINKAKCEMEQRRNLDLYMQTENYISRIKESDSKIFQLQSDLQNAEKWKSQPRVNGKFASKEVAGINKNASINFHALGKEGDYGLVIINKEDVHYFASAATKSGFKMVGGQSPMWLTKQKELKKVALLNPSKLTIRLVSEEQFAKGQQRPVYFLMKGKIYQHGIDPIPVWGGENGVAVAQQ